LRIKLFSVTNLTDNTNKGENKSGRMDVMNGRPGSTLYILRSKRPYKKYETRNKTLAA